MKTKTFLDLGEVEVNKSESNVKQNDSTELLAFPEFEISNGPTDPIRPQIGFFYRAPLELL